MTYTVIIIIISILLYKCMCIGVDDLQDVKTEVFDIASLWDSFALTLGLRKPIIEQIKRDNLGRYIVKLMYIVRTYISCF